MPEALKIPKSSEVKFLSFKYVSEGGDREKVEKLFHLQLPLFCDLVAISRKTVEPTFSLTFSSSR